MNRKAPISKGDTPTSDALLKSIFAAAPVGIGLVRDRVILQVNQRVCEMTGYRREELIGLDARLLYPDQDEYERVGNEKYGQIRRHGLGTVQTRWRRKDGHALDVLLSSSPLEGRDLSAGVTFTVMDISERVHAQKQFRDSEQRHRMLFENSPDGIITVNSKLKVTDCNPAFLALTGFSREEIVGKTVHRLPTLIKRDIPRYMKLLTDVRAGKPLKELEFRWKHENGSIRWGEATVSRFSSVKGQDEFQCIVRDITDRREMADQVKRERDRARHYLDLAGAIVLSLNRSGRITMINRGGCDLLGVSREDAEGSNWFDRFIPGGEKDAVLRYFKGILKGKTDPTVREGSVVTAKGRERKIQWWNTLIRDESGRVEGTLSTGIDITEKLKTEEALQIEQTYLERLFASAPDGIALVENDGRIIRVNPRFSEIFGFSRQESAGRLIDELVVPSEFMEEGVSVSDRVASGRSLSLKTVRRDKSGRRIDVDVVASPIKIGGKQEAIYYIYRDISDRVRAEELLRASEERFRTLFENLVIGIYRTTPDGQILMANPALVKLLGFDSFEDLKTRNLEKGGFEPDYPRREFKEQIEKNGEIVGLETAWHNRQGATVYVRESARCIRGEDGKTLFYEGTVEDITAKKKTEMKLRESEARFAMIFNTARDGIIWLSENGQIKEVNPAFERITGIATTEVIGRGLTETILRYLPGKHRVKVFRNIKALAGGETIQPFEMEFNGRVLEVTAAFRRRGEGVVGVIRDITERKAAERKIQDSLKEKEVLLQEIHHRVKNNLQVVSSLLGLQVEKVENKAVHTVFQESQRRILSMALVHEKLYQSGEFSRVEFAQYLTDLVRQLFSNLDLNSDQVALDQQLDPVMLSIDQAIPAALVVNELVSNALKHAFPSGWKKKKRLTLRLRMSGRGEILLTVADNGVGMDRIEKLAAAESFGMRLIHLLAEKQLGGRVAFEIKSGTTVTVRFAGEA